MTSILIVEDDEAIADLVSTSLNDEGYRCVCAFDGEEGADRFEQEFFDLVLLDIMLPKVNGYDLLEYIKPSGTPVIFLTAKGEVQDRIKGLKQGADDYLAKPFQIGELLARVEAVLRRFGKSEKVWKEPFTGETRTLDSHIQRLRKKLNMETQIKTVFRIGYRLEG